MTHFFSVISKTFRSIIENLPIKQVQSTLWVTVDDCHRN